MLAWFLEHVERREPEDIPDLICDGNGDKGLDAIAVDDEAREITLFQAKRMASESKTQGDLDIKNLIGAAEYFKTTETVRGLLDSKPNPQLSRLLNREEILSKVEAGYKVGRLVFVTNADLDAAGHSLVATHETGGLGLEVWDRSALKEVADRVRRADMRSETVKLTASSSPLRDELDGNARLAVAIIPATELVKMPGIVDMTLFSRNVRLSVGKTRINKELAATVADSNEHELFVASHNGITILTEGLSVRGRTLTLRGVSVVNGCQSMVALHAASANLTPELRMVVKIVELPTVNSSLSDVITYRANNQNAVNMRDQRATDSTQVGLQRQVKDVFGKKFSYLIKSGESSGGEVLDNSLAAQLITAVYRSLPWAAVRKLRLFDQDYREIFSSKIDAHKLRHIWMINSAVEAARDDLTGELRSAFASVRFTIASLVSDVLRQSLQGREILSEPERWLPSKNDEVQAKLNDLAREVSMQVNGYVKDREVEASERETDFDAKTVFKSMQGVAPLQRELTTVARRLGEKDPGYLFGIEPA